MFRAHRSDRCRPSARRLRESGLRRDPSRWRGPSFPGRRRPSPVRLRQAPPLPHPASRLPPLVATPATRPQPPPDRTARTVDPAGRAPRQRCRSSGALPLAPAALRRGRARDQPRQRRPGARRACRSRKSPSTAGFQLNTMRRASRVTPSTVSSTAAPSPCARASGHASTTLVTASSLSAARSSSAARSLGAPASISTERSFKTRPVRPRPVTAWMERSSGAAATHSAALASSAHTTSTRGPTPGPCPGLSGPSSSHRSRACSTAGGRTSTTGRPRSSAAFASASVTRSSVVKGRSVGREGSAWWRERQRRLGSGCVPLAVRAILPPMTPGSGLSPNLHHLETSATIAISQEAKRRKAAGEDVIDLGAGEPDFPTPSLPSDAGVRAIREGKTHYPANEGILELRAAAAKHLSLLSGGRPVNADNIVVSNGSKQSLFNVCFTLFGPGEVVAIPAPAWVSYPQIVYLSRARPVLVPGEPEWSLKVSVRDLDRVVPGARGLILCSPCNPTGAVYTQAEIKAIAHWARDRKVWIVADEIYRRIHYGTGPSPSFLDLPDDLLERVVVIYGVSKAYAMTGWRIGLALAPGPVAKAMAALQSHTTTGANHPAQVAAAAALGDDRVEQDVGRMVAEFRKRRDLVVTRFRQDLPGVEFVEPLGAFYFFFRVDSFGGIGGTEFCTRLITTTGVALVPGAAFGDDRYVRLSYAAATDQLQKALDRVVGFAKKLAD